jgi:hypothetical protein
MASVCPTEINVITLGSVLSRPYGNDAARATRQASHSPPRTTLAAILNSLAHGDPFDDLPRSGLFELTPNLIRYANRDAISEGRVLGSSFSAPVRKAFVELAENRITG